MLDKCKVNIESLELSISYHCNISCKGCSHCSPLFKEEYFDIYKEIESLKILSKYLNIKIIKLIGGEPLLNKDIDKIIQILKNESIGDKIYVATNGLLLNKMSEYFWKNIDGLEVSVYKPGFESVIENLIKNKFYRKNQQAYIYCYDKFRYPFVKSEIINKELVKHIYKNCLFARDWQCFNYNKGYFFKCPQSWVIAEKFQLLNFDDVGVKIEDTDKCAQLLYNYINSENPIKSCNYCLGCVGKLFSIQQVNRNNFINCIPDKIDNFIDMEFLNKLDIDRDVLIETLSNTIEIYGNTKNNLAKQRFYNLN